MSDKLDVNLGLSNNKIDKIAELMLNRDTSKPIKQKIQLDGADKVIKELTTIYGLSENVAKSLENIYKTGKNNRANYLFNYKDETLALNKIIEAYDKFQNTRDNKDRTNFLATTSFVKAGRGNLDFLPNNIAKEYEDIYKEITGRSSGEKYAYSVSNFKSFIDVIEQAQQEQQENIALLENLAKFLSSSNNKETKASIQLRKKFHNVNYEDLVNYNEDELLEYFESVNKLYKETSEEYLKLKSKLQSREQAQSKLEKINNKISSLEFSHFGKDPYDVLYDEITELQNLKHERNTLKTLMAVPDNFLTDDEMKTLENNDFPHKIRRLQEQLYGIYMIAEQMGFEDAKFTKDAEIDLHDAMTGIPGLIKGLIEKNDIAAETNKQVNSQIDFREAFESEGILNADFKNIRDIIQNLLKRMIESKLNAFYQLLDDDSFIKSVQNEFGSQANEIINRYKTDADNNILKNTLEDYYDQLLRELSNEGLFDTEEYAKTQLEKYRLRINDQNLDDYDSFVNDFLAKINDTSNNIKGFDKITIALSDFYDEIDDKGWRKINPLQQRINSLFGIGTGINNGGEESNSFSSEEKKVGTSEDYSKILNLLERIYDVFKDIANTTSLLSQSIGIITDENGFNSLLSSLKEVNEYFQNIKDAVIDISSRDLSPTLNIQANQNNDPYAIRKKAQRYKENYENAFNEIGYTNLFSFLAQSNVSEKYEFSADKLKKQFGSEAINGIENKEDQIERIVQFFNLIDKTIDERASEIERATKLLEQGIGTQSSLDALTNDEIYRQLIENRERRFVSTNQKYINKTNAQLISQANGSSPLSSANKLLDSLNDASIVGKLDEILAVTQNIYTTLETKRTRGTGEGAGRNSLVDSFKEQILPLYNQISDRAKYNPEKGIWKYSSDTTADDLNISAEITKAIKKAREKNVDIAKLFSEDGQDIAEGVAKGIGEGQVDINKELDNIKENSQEYFEKINGIHSPARDWYPIGENLTLGIAEGVRQGYYDLRDAMDYITELAKTEAGRNLIAEDDTQKIDFKNMVSPISELRWEMLKNGYSNEQADETIFNMHEELYKEGINRKSALSTIFNNDEKEKIEEITEALREYYITLKEIDPFATKVNDNGDEFNVVDIGDELRDKLKNGTITEDEIRDIYQEKFQNAFNKLSNLFPNIDADQLGDILKESNIINAFDSIEDAGQHLYMALVNNLDISSVIESGLNKHGFSKLENEVENTTKRIDSDLENNLNPVQIKVDPLVDAREFADKVTDKLKNVSAEIKADVIGSAKDFYDNDNYQGKKIINSLTGKEISPEAYVALNKLHAGQKADYEALKKLPEIIEAANRLDNISKEFKERTGLDDTSQINTAERKALREDIKQKILGMGSYSGYRKENGEKVDTFEGKVDSNGRIDIVIGLPAAGKSTSLALPLSELFHSRILDSDMIKEELPEFNGGWGASLVHEESGEINKELFKQLITTTKDNIILPIVGDSIDKINEKYINELIKQGYDVHVWNNELEKEHSVERGILRFFNDGRYLPIDLFQKYEEKPNATYEALKKQKNIKSIAKYNNNVKKGQRPTLVETNGVDQDVLDYLAGWKKGEYKSVPIEVQANTESLTDEIKEELSEQKFEIMVVPQIDEQAKNEMLNKIGSELFGKPIITTTPSAENTSLIPAPNEFTNRDVEYGFTMKDAEEASEEFAEETKEATKAAVGFKTELNEIGDEVLNLLSTSHRYLTDAEGNIIADGKRSFKGQKESGRIVKKTLVEERDQDGNLTGNLAIAVDEETNYAKIVKEAANAVVELTKAEHALALEQAKENPNEENIKEYTKLIDNLKLKLQAQTDAAKDFANSFEFFYNDQQFDSNYMMKMFNRNVDQAALDRIAKSNINYNNALEAMQKREVKQIEAVNDKLLQQETRLNNIRATYDQSIAPGVSKPVTIIENLEELNKLYDELQNKINSLKGTNASKDDMREISQMMEAYKLRAKVLKDSNNPTKREMGGQELNVAIQQELANLDKLIEKSQKYGSVTKDITKELIQQKKILVEENKKEESEKDVGILYDTQNIRKYNDALLKSETIKYRQSEEIYNKELDARKEILKLQHQIDMADAKHANNADEIRAKNEAKITLKQQELDEIAKQRKGHTNRDLRSSVEAELKRIRTEYDQQLQTQKSITAEVEKRKAEEAHAKAVTDRYEEQLKIEKEIAKLEHQIALDKINGNDSSLHQYDLDKANERLDQFKANNSNYTDDNLSKQNRSIIKDLKERYQIEERIAQEAKNRNESASQEKERIKETNRLYKELNNDFKKYKSLIDSDDTDSADKLRSDIIARQFDLRQGSNYNADKDFELTEKFRKWSDRQRANESKEAYKSIEADIDAYIGYLKKEQGAVGKEREEYHKLAEEKRKTGLTALAGLRDTDKYDKASQDKISRKISNAKLDIRSNQSKKALDEEENQVINLISEYKKLIKNYEDIRKKQIKGTKLSDVENDFLNNYTNSITVYEKFLDAVKDDARYQQRINELLNAREQSYQNINNALTSELGTLKLEEKYTETFRNEWKELQNDIELFKENVNNGLLNESEIDDQINRLQQRIRDIKLERGTSNSLLASDEDINKQMAAINKTLYDSSSMSRKLRDEFKLLRADYAKLLDSDAPQSALDELNTRLAKLKNELHEAGYYGKSFFTQFKEGIRNRTVQTLATYFSFQDIIRYGREFLNTIEQLDTALVDLRKTTSMSTAELDEFYYSSNKIAKQMGVTTQEIIQQAANWSRLGYSTKEASEQMAALSSQFAAISPGMDVGTATDGLVSAMKAFHVEVDNVESEIMDPVNRLGNTMATTNEEIVEMLERSSAAMYAANNSIEETLALESAAVQITRNAESTGTAFRTISMRIRGKSLPPYMETYMLCA